MYAKQVIKLKGCESRRSYLNWQNFTRPGKIHDFAVVESSLKCPIYQTIKRIYILVINGQFNQTSMSVYLQIVRDLCSVVCNIRATKRQKSRALAQVYSTGIKREIIYLTIKEKRKKERKLEVFSRINILDCKNPRMTRC